jgi:hypothetical protein
MYYPAVVLGSSSIVEVVICSDDEMTMEFLQDTDMSFARAEPRQWLLLVNRLLPFAIQLQKLSLQRSVSKQSHKLPTSRPISQLLNSVIQNHHRRVSIPQQLGPLGALSRRPSLRRLCSILCVCHHAAESPETSPYSHVARIRQALPRHACREAASRADTPRGAWTVCSW